MPQKGKRSYKSKVSYFSKKRSHTSKRKRWKGYKNRVKKARWE